jgi:hypothetical protein
MSGWDINPLLIPSKVNATRAISQQLNKQRERYSPRKTRVTGIEQSEREGRRNHPIMWKYRDFEQMCRTRTAIPVQTDLSVPMLAPARNSDKLKA